MIFFTKINAKDDRAKVLDERIIADELDKHIVAEEKKKQETDQSKGDKAGEKGSKTMKKLKIIRQKTVEFVQGKELDKMVGANTIILKAVCKFIVSKQGRQLARGSEK